MVYLYGLHIFALFSISSRVEQRCENYTYHIGDISDVKSVELTTSLAFPHVTKLM
jgi:hypothetical protein